MGGSRSSSPPPAKRSCCRDDGLVAPSRPPEHVERSVFVSPDRPVSLVLLAGQSNMAGRGRMGEQQDLDKKNSNRPSDSNGSDGRSVQPPDLWSAEVLAWTPQKKWVVAAHPLHWDKPEKVGVGPGLAFAETLIAFHRGDQAAQQGDALKVSPPLLGLVPAAVGGSGIVEWLPEEDVMPRHATDCQPSNPADEIPTRLIAAFNSTEGTRGEAAPGHLLHEALARLRAALAASPPGSRVLGVLWHQGETDAGTKDLAHVYPQRLRRFLRRLVEELRYLNNGPRVESLGSATEREAPLDMECEQEYLGPVLLLGGLGDFLEKQPKSPEWRSVNDSVMSEARALEEECGPGLVRFITAEGLTHKGDHLHFDALASEELGRRFAASFRELCAESGRSCL